MPDPRDLLICLLDYIKEQAKQINPAAYRLANAKGFQRQRGDMAGLPGVEFDIKVAGDHVWLRVPRLAAEPPPPPPPAWKALLRFSAEPNGQPPSIDEAVLARQINQRAQSAIEPLGALEHTSTMVEKRVWRAPVEETIDADAGTEELQGRLL